MRRIPGITLALALFSMAGTARAISIISNHELLPEGTTLQQCLFRAQGAIAAAGLNALEPTNTAAWGQNAAGDELYSIYCVPDRASAVFMGSTERNADAVDTMVTRLREAFRSGGRARPVK